MIGVKSIAVVTLAAIAFAIAIARFSIDHITEMTLASGFWVGLFASLGAALVGFGAEAKSRAAIVLRPLARAERGRGGRVIDLAVDLPRTHPDVRELPAVVQRALLVGVFGCVGLATFTTDAAARIASVPADLAEPSRAAYCLPPEPVKKDAAPAPIAPPPPPVDQAGCALVKRAFQLGYAKSLGSCAPKAAPAPAVAVDPSQPSREVCDRRELDEPFLHYTWRRVVDVAQGASPSDYSGKRIEEFQTRLDYIRDLLADIKHSITGTAHGSHHIFITLADPHPTSSLAIFTGEERCANRFADLPLWPAWTARSQPGEIVEHVLGQLLFATRFGTPASCSDYTIHWDASRDICTKLATDPAAVLDAHDALAPIRSVLDRRHRQAQLHALATTLGRAATLPPTPPASSVVSVSCLVVGDAGGFSGTAITIDGEPISLRNAHIPAITHTNTLDIYAALAHMLAGTTYGGATAANARTAIEPLDPLTDPTFPLARLEPLAKHDPFIDKTALRPEVIDVYPFDAHLHAFIEAFRRIYYAQRGRL